MRWIELVGRLELPPPVAYSPLRPANRHRRTISAGRATSDVRRANSVGTITFGRRRRRRRLRCRWHRARTPCCGCIENMRIFIIALEYTHYKQWVQSYVIGLSKVHSYQLLLRPINSIVHTNRGVDMNDSNSTQITCVCVLSSCVVHCGCYDMIRARKY